MTNILLIIDIRNNNERSQRIADVNFSFLETFSRVCIQYMRNDLTDIIV